MAGVEPKDSRNRDDLPRITRQATDFLWTVRMRGIDQAAVGTIPWTRRQLLDVALELAQRHTDAARAIRDDVPGGRSAAQRARIAREDATWTDDESNAAHFRYAKGERGDYVRQGHRVYIRRQRRARGARALALIEGQEGGAA